MSKNVSITSIRINLEIEGQQTLFIFMAEDGTIQRMGYGNESYEPKDLYIGSATENCFKEFRDDVKDEYLTYAGTYTSEDSKGLLCRLTVEFSTGEADYNFEYKYGSESAGPHQEIMQLVKKAIDVTEPWFLQQKQLR